MRTKAVGKAKQRVCKCLRCSWLWIQRRSKNPVECPRCRSRRWDEPKEKK